MTYREGRLAAYAVSEYRVDIFIIAFQKQKRPHEGEFHSAMVESLEMTWNLIKRQLIVASEIYQSLRITYLIET